MKPPLASSALALVLLFAISTLSQNAPPKPTTPTTYHDSFEQGYLFFDDAVGVLHVRQSGSTAETDYASGISSSDGGIYARLLVQPWLQPPCTNGTNCGINGDQSGRCNPGNPEVDNGFSCGGPFTEWGLPFGGYDGSFDTGIPINNGARTSIDIYLDIAFAASATLVKDYRFDWDSDLLDSQKSFLQDYIFNVATGDSPTDLCKPLTGGYYVIQASYNSQRSGANAHFPSGNGQACISQSGWYTFEHFFRPDHMKNLEVDMVILDSHHRVVASWALHPTCMGTQASEGLCTVGMPLPFSAVGYNFLGWLPDQEINDLAIDDVQRIPTGPDQDMGVGRGTNNNSFQFVNSSSQPQTSTLAYNDPSAGLNLQSVNGVTSVAYNTPCVSFAGDALVNGNPGYAYTFAACDLSVLGTGIGNYTIAVTGPSGFLYQQTGALMSGFVSIHGL